MCARPGLTRAARLFVCVAAGVFLLFDTGVGGGQDTTRRPTGPRRLEIQDQSPVAVSREGRRTSPAYRISSTSFFAVQVNIDDSSRNIVGDAANEPSIAVDPTNPNRMAIGWRQFDTVVSSFRQAGYGLTTDGGLTWRFPGVIDPGVFRSDPVLESDSAGTFYYNSLTNSPTFYCDVFKSTDGGATWDAGTFAQGGDKQWMAIDKVGGPGTGNIYAFWTYAYSVCSPGFFTRSADGGFFFEDCLTIPSQPYWGTLDVGPNHELYVGGAGGGLGFIVAASSNAWDSSQPVSWDFSMGVDLGGDIEVGAGPNPGGLLGQTWIAVDRSSGPTRGNVYMLCSVNPTAGTDPLDVMFARSTDGGITWSAPMRINDDTSTAAWQWFGTMSVAPNGRIDVIWLDTRNNPGTYLSSLYYANSMDGGVTWSPNERLSEAFNPHVGWPVQQKMGDYFDMVSDDAGASIAWAGTFNGEQDVYYGRVTVVTGVVEREPGVPKSASLSQNFPNPFNPRTLIRFQIPGEIGRRTSGVRLKVYDLLGQEIATLVDDEMGPGSYEVTWDASGFSSGVYFYRLNAGEYMETKKLVLLR